MEDIILNCPHCKHVVIVNRKDINCAIFRHAIRKDNGEQIDPHSSKDICDSLVRKAAFLDAPNRFAW